MIRKPQGRERKEKKENEVERLKSKKVEGKRK